MTLDVAGLTNAYLADDYQGILAPYLEISDIYNPPHTVIRTDIWTAIWDEIERRERRLEQQTFDMRSRRLGYRDWPAVLRHIGQLLKSGETEQAGKLYWAVVR